MLRGVQWVVRLPRPPSLVPSRGRKSRFDPPAKSKSDRIKYPPIISIQELLNVQRRYREYTTLLTALRSQCKSELLRQRLELQVGSLAEQRHHQEKAEHQILITWNLEENKKILIRRLDRMSLEEKEMRLQRQEVTRLKEEENRKRIQEREEEVETLQEISKTFISPENLMEKIQEALQDPKNYNYCLDPQGRSLTPSSAPKSSHP